MVSKWGMYMGWEGRSSNSPIVVVEMRELRASVRSKIFRAGPVHMKCL